MYIKSQVFRLNGRRLALMARVTTCD